MSEMDWHRILALSPEELNEQDKDDLLDTVVWYVPEMKVEKNRLISFIRVCQEILKYKAEQVESLVNELDELASRQGEEEARNKQELLDELEDLRTRVAYNERMDKNGAPATKDEMRSEIVRLEMQNEELIAELQDREKELLAEKSESENLASIVATLEREKMELTRELAALHEETAAKMEVRGFRDSPEFTAEKQEELLDIIRQKNKHLAQLLTDANIIEEENNALREKLSHVKEELSDATKHLTDMTEEISRLNYFKTELEDRCSNMSEKNKSLHSQIEELVEQKQLQDKQLDDFTTNLDGKVRDWKTAIETKDSEIEHLRQELSKFMTDPNLVHSSNQSEREQMKLKLKTQEEQMHMLKNELSKATEEINKSADLIEKMKDSKRGHQETETDTLVKQLEETIATLNEKLKYAEEDARKKAEEASELIVQIRQFESGEYGLAEASLKIRELKKQIDIRDKQIEELVDVCNSAKEEINNLEEQNLAYHEKLGLPPDTAVSTNSIKLKRLKEQELIKNLQTRLDTETNKSIELEMKCRKLSKIIKKFRLKILDKEIESSDSHETEENHKTSTINLKERLEMIIKENEALRKGMHEILDSIRQQDVTSSVEVRSECLEQLMQVLDTRHISGWYHPAMRLQAEVHSLEGHNQELRDLIRHLRIEGHQMSLELNEAQSTIESVKDEKSEATISDAKGSDNKVQGDIVHSSAKLLELQLKVDEMKILNSKIELDSEQMVNEISQEKEILKIKKEQCEERLKTLEKYFEECKSGSILEKEMAEFAIEKANTSSQLFASRRENEYLKDLVKFLKSQNVNMKKVLFEAEDSMLSNIVNLHTEKSKLIINTEDLAEKLSKSVPAKEVQLLKDELIKVNAKYRHVLDTVNMVTTESRLITDEEVNNLKEEKSKLLNELKDTKQMLISTQTLLNASEFVTQDEFDNQISILASKLAATEVNEINEKQKSEYLEKLNECLRTELEQMNKRCKDLMEKLRNVNENNYQLQEVERGLRSQLLSCCSQETFVKLSEHVEDLEKRYKLVEIDKDNLQELLDISRKQFRLLEFGKEIQKLWNDSLLEEVLLLQSCSDEKAAIARLSHELLTTHMKISELTSEMNEMKSKLSKTKIRNLCLESKLEDSNGIILKTKEKCFHESQFFLKIIHGLRLMYVGALPFHDYERFSQSKLAQLNFERDAEQKLKSAKNIEFEYRVKLKAMEIQIDSLDSLEKGITNGENQKLMMWHNKITELRLNESKAKLQNEFLQAELDQLEKHVGKLRQYILELEEEGIKREKDWEEKQSVWEDSKLQVQEFLTVETQSDDTMKTELARKLENALQVVKNYTEVTKKLESENAQLNEHVRVLNKQLNEIKNENATIPIKFFKEDLPTVMYEPNHLMSSEKIALKQTVESLQNIIQQKEDTIQKFQTLLKESRDEHSRAAGRLQEEIHTLHTTLSTQTQALNKLKNSVLLESANKEPIPSSAFDNYVKRLRELEDEVTEAHNSLSEKNNELVAAKQEVERWRKMAEDRLDNLERIQLRRDSFDKSVVEEKDIRTLAEDHVNNKIANSLDQKLEESYMKQEELQKAMLELKVKLEQYSAERHSDSFEPKEEKRNREIENLNSKIKVLEMECEKLRQENKSSTQRSRRPSISSRHSDEPLQAKVKHLEAMLQAARNKEEESSERELKRLKSTEEVARWEERKKHVHTIEKLNAKFKEKETECEFLRSKNESLKSLVQRIERERNFLEAQLKSEKPASAVVVRRIDDLLDENRELKRELDVMKMKLEAHICHSGNLGTALLEERLENQERKITALELTKGHSQSSRVSDELVRLQSINAALEKTNLRLESENLELNLKLEKERVNSKRLLEQVDFLERHLRASQVDDREKESLQKLVEDQDKTVTELKKTIDKLRAEHKRVLSSEPPVRGVSSATGEKLKRELNKLREDHKKLQTQFLDSVQKCTVLEEEVQKYRLQIQLLEERNLAQSIAKTNNIQMSSDLSQELLQVKAQLMQKTQLLEKVKVLLKKAAAKEKTLHEQVASLRCLVPHDVLQSHNI